MPKFRKRPVVIEAFQLLDDLNCKKPAWFFDAVCIGAINSHPDGLIIKTLEGDHLARWGDYIIQGVKGEPYPCKPDIFARTYEPAEEEES